jgi:hypothetical protein
LLSDRERATLGIELQPREVKVKGKQQALLLYAAQVP